MATAEFGELAPPSLDRMMLRAMAQERQI